MEARRGGQLFLRQRERERGEGGEVDTFGGLNHRETIRVDDKEDGITSVNLCSETIVCNTVHSPTQVRILC